MLYIDEAYILGILFLFTVIGIIIIKIIGLFLDWFKKKY